MIFFTLLSFISCGSERPKDCANTADCSINEVCRQQQCESVSCLSSSDCSWSEFCEMGVCLPGCTLDSDCMAGLSCILGQCEKSSCQDTQIDCSFGEYCRDGACVQSELPVCQRCGYMDWEMGMDEAMECVTYRFFQGQFCDWPEGDQCEPDLTCFPGADDPSFGFCVELFAFAYCETDHDCPQGFSCWQDIYGTNSGVSVCEANCNSYFDLPSATE